MNSVFLIDKHAGITSFEVIKELKHLLNLKKIGHSGTLDKFASGLLVVCTGWATKLNRYFLDSDKRYIGTIKLGVTTDTLDSEGKVTVIKEISGPILNSIQKIPEKFTGFISQLPPDYSALKIKGKRASDRIRKGEKIILNARDVKISKLDILKIDLDNYRLTIDVTCSKGTYIRSLARDIGSYLGTGGHLENLRRISSGNFTIENAATLEEIKNHADGKPIDKNFSLRPGEALSHLSSIIIKNSVKFKIFNGASFIKDDIISVNNKSSSQFTIFDEEENLIAIAEVDIDNCFIKYLNVFNNK